MSREFWVVNLVRFESRVRVSSSEFLTFSPFSLWEKGAGDEGLTKDPKILSCYLRDKVDEARLFRQRLIGVQTTSKTTRGPSQLSVGQRK